MYQFLLQLLIKNSNHGENIASCLKNIFVYPGREIFVEVCVGVWIYQFPLKLLYI